MVSLRVTSRMKPVWDISVVIFIILSLVEVKLCQSLEYSIPEEQPAGRFVLNVALDSELNVGMNESDFQTLRYSILATGKHYRYFSLNQTSGFLYTATVIDRETICPYSDECKLYLEITAQSTIKSFFKKIRTWINIEDINDNGPVFEKDITYLTIPEDVRINTAFTIDGAKDADTSQNYSLQSYSLSPENWPFSLQFVKNLDGTSTVKLIVSGPLDREKRDFYELTVIAKDGGSPPKTAEMTVDVHVSDVNDNAPVLSSSIYNVSVQEDVSIGTVIYRLRATDFDSGKNAEIVYKLSPHQSDEIKRTFSINQTSGELSVLESLTYVHGAKHKVIVEVSDSGTPSPRTTQVYVVVTVLDTANSPPEIRISVLGTSTNVGHVTELAEFGTTVAHVVVVDRDSGRNGIVSCNINSVVFELQSMDINEYRVIVSQPLDREQQATHDIVVFCHDNGTPSLVSNADFVIELIDENDNPPVFDTGHYRTRIYENNKIGEEIIRVDATDADEDINAKVRYRLIESNDTVVQIDHTTGVIRATKSYDREQTPQGFSFKVVAADGGNPTRFGTAMVSVSIIDVNDETPKFTGELKFKRRENRPPGTIVGRLTATDKDIGDNAKLTFMLNEPKNKYIPFIVYTSGYIKTTAVLDREKKSSYTFSVAVSDTGPPMRSSTSRVLIIVEDDNDNFPVIDFPNNINRSVSISHRTPPGSVVATVKAHDIDEGLNAQLAFIIDGHNDTGIFRIIYETGDVILQKSVQNNAGSVFNLNVVVSDFGEPARRTRQNLMIKVSSDIGTPLQLNVVIVISLVAVTLVLSTGIVLVICIIRHYDNGKQNTKKASNGQVIANGVAHGVRNNTNMQAYTAVAEDPVETERKRKEVTFSFSDDQLESNNTLYETKNKSGRQTTFGDSIGPTFLKLQDDNHSETSGETNTSDSGRGLSDDEFHATRGQSFHKNKGNLRNKPSLEINLYSGHHAYFPDGREQHSPIELSRFTAYPPYTSKNNRFPGGSFAVHKPLQTFQYETKAPSLDEDSRSTSGIHTMEEETNEL